ncbi:hypothetical protein GCM10017744_018650 [Streptomyces antimycoticus]
MGSLLLGLYDAAGKLQHVGVSAAFTARRRQELLAELEPLAMETVEGHPWADWAREEAHAAGRMPGAQPLDRGQGSVVAAAAPGAGVRGGLRPHAERPLPAHRPLPALAAGPGARQCTYEQLEEPVSYDLRQVLGSSAADA